MPRRRRAHAAHPQEHQHCAAEGGTRDRVRPAGTLLLSAVRHGEKRGASAPTGTLMHRDRPRGTAAVCRTLSSGMKALAVASIQPRRFRIHMIADSDSRLALTGGMHATPPAAAADFISKRNGNPARNFGVFFGGLCVTRCKKTAFVLTISHKLRIEKQIKAFDLLVNFWSERRDLNSGPPVPQTGALTGLRYAPNSGDYSG